MRTKKATVPIGRLPSSTIFPPMPTTRAVVPSAALDHGQVPGLHEHRPHVRPVERVVPTLEAPDLHVLATVGLDDPDPADALLERRQREADAVADGEVRPVGVALELDRREHHDRHRDQADEQQLPGDDAEEHHRPDDEQQRGEQLEEALLHQLLERVHVGGHAADDDARLLPVVEGHRQPQEVVEHPRAQVAQEALAGLADEQHLGPGRGVGDDRHDDVGGHGCVEHVDPSGHDPPVDAHLEQVRAGEHGERRHDHARPGPAHLPLVGVQHLPGAAQHLAGLAAIELVVLVHRGHGHHGAATSSAPALAPTSPTRAAWRACSSAAAAEASTSR
ncbi:MAG: hypothetical protein R2702_17210 [Acidimicrobiales bacterium]